MSIFNTRTFTIKRRAGSYVNGRWAFSTPVEIQASGSLQPTDGEKMQTLLAGRRASSIYVGYTNTPIFTTNQIAGEPSDTIVIDGQDYEIIQSEPWLNNIISHYKFVAMRSKE